MHEQAHTLGRGGLGAVFGSKMLEGGQRDLAGSRQAEAQDQFVQTRREISQLGCQQSQTARRVDSARRGG